MKSLTKLWKLYSKEKSISLSPGTIQHNYKQVLNWIKKCPVQDVKEGREIMSWILSQKPEKSSRKVAIYVKSLYKWGSSSDVGLIKKNYILSYQLPKNYDKEDIIVIPVNEVNPFLEGLKSSRTQDKWYLFSEFLLQTGMRPGEARALTWDDIKSDEIFVSKTSDMNGSMKMTTKTNKSRKVPINKKCREVLKESKNLWNSEFVFPLNRRTYVDYFKVKATDMCNAGITTTVYRPYDLRHTAISAWIENNIPVNQCAKWAGNSPDIIWNHYCNVRSDFVLPEI
jgi:integrase